MGLSFARVWQADSLHHLGLCLEDLPGSWLMSEYFDSCHHNHNSGSRLTEYGGWQGSQQRWRRQIINRRTRRRHYQTLRQQLNTARFFMGTRTYYTTMTGSQVAETGKRVARVALDLALSALYVTRPPLETRGDRSSRRGIGEVF